MKTTVVVTSISGPNAALQSIAAGCIRHGHDFYVIGDQASPAEFVLEAVNSSASNGSAARI